MKYAKGLFLSVPTPCSENWDEMTHTAAGKHCSRCAKTVIDFSSMSDAEILAMLRNSKGEVCGHFQSSQLDRLIAPPPATRSNFLPALLLTAGMITGIANQGYAEARTLEEVEMQLTPLQESLPEDTTKSSLKSYNLPELVVTGFATRTGKIVMGATTVTTIEKRHDCSPLNHPEGRFIDPVYPTDKERQQSKKRRWFK
ncbi:hypothetical protein [Chitinophaga sp. HK235]|uniref:hypothetical protein n=1 Tax=Chitinophaga sp. HK235 TaxID=2952571 RepID=UPI001BA56F2E|nr:hypothetical protein [Chitinophaga sp. HK235]